MPQPRLAARYRPRRIAAPRFAAAGFAPLRERAAAAARFGAGFSRADDAVFGRARFARAGVLPLVRPFGPDSSFVSRSFSVRFSSISCRSRRAAS